MRFPGFLKPGDRIAILSPASCIKPEYVDGAYRVLSQWGFSPVVSAHCCDRGGYYSASRELRLADIRNAFADPSIKAILCSRGGYGTVHLIEDLHPSFLQEHPKWVVGFSDISVLHAAMNAAGIASIHASMTKHLALFGESDSCSIALRDALCGSLPHYEVPAHPFNRFGSVTGEIVGGNMAVLCGLISTDIDIFHRDKILFIEDVGEPIYKIERMLYDLRLAGILPNLKGLIVGRFTEFTEPDASGETMNEMIRRMVAPYDYPVAFDFPIGHIDENVPIVEGATATVTVTPLTTTLDFCAE